MVYRNMTSLHIVMATVCKYRLWATSDICKQSPSVLWTFMHLHTTAIYQDIQRVQFTRMCPHDYCDLKWSGSARDIN